MDKARILATAVVQWDAEDQCYVMQSPEADYVLGAGDTEAEARTAFIEMLEANYEAFLAGTHGILNARKVGRPVSGRVSLNTHIHSETKSRLKSIAKSNRKSIGQVIEILVNNMKGVAL